jgi:hypothetical protein
MFTINRDKKIAIIIFLVVLIKQMTWMGLVPLWHFPDEQAHFAQVQNIAYFGLVDVFAKGIVTSSDEIAISELLLGTFRDDMGRNRYTFHPEYNLSYTDSTIGLREDEIRSLPHQYSLNEDLYESTLYPPLYYWVGSLGYKLAWDSSLIDRVFLVRSLSIIMFSMGAFASFIIGLKIFKSRIWAIALTVLVMFQPMYSFVGAGVTSDVLFNTIFSFFLLAGLLVIEKLTFKRVMLLFLFLFLGSLSKQQMLIAILLVPLIFAPHYKTLWNMLKDRYALGLGMLLLCVLAVVAMVQLGEFRRIHEFITSGPQYSNPGNISLVEHVRWVLTHTYREVLPWYWGIFKWLGVTLPRWVHRVQMGLIAGALIGNLFFLISLIRSYSQRSKILIQNKYILFLYGASAFYFICLMIWDYFFRRAYGFSFGMQGRYYFPVIIGHMVFLLVGWREMIGSILKKLFKSDALVLYLPVFLSAWWLVLHAIALWTVGRAYYDTQDISLFILQVSQYKPAIFKGSWWIIWGMGVIGSYVAVLILLIRNLRYEKISH